MPITIPPKPQDTPLCAICKRRPATKQCDFPVDKCRYIGHPPRYLMDKAHRMDTAFLELKMSWTITCDKPICDQCSISTGNEIDFCSTHIQEMLGAKNKKK